MNIEDVEVLEGWYSFPEAADLLKVRRQRINQLLEEDKLGPKEVRRVKGSGSRPAALLVSSKAVDRLLAEKAAAEDRRVAAESARAGHQAAAASAA
jgi:hypothetical protein